MNKRNLLRLVVLTSFGLAGFVLLCWWLTPNLRLNRESFEQIQVGMTDAEVSAVLGGAPTNQGRIGQGPSSYIVAL